MLAYAFATALLASVSISVVLADLTATALLAFGSLTTVLADLAATALLAIPFQPAVLADAAASALLASVSPTTVLASQMLAIPDSYLALEIVLFTDNSVSLSLGEVNHSTTQPVSHGRDSDGAACES